MYLVFSWVSAYCQLRGEENYYRLSLYEADNRTFDEIFFVKSANCPISLKMSIWRQKPQLIDSNQSTPINKPELIASN